MKKLLRLVLLLALSNPILGLTAVYGSALKPDTLRIEPFADAKTAGILSKNERIEILKKKGAWLQVKSTKSTGWVRLLSVKRGDATSINQLGGAIEVATGRAGTGKVVSTTGIRGLSTEELKAAKFNETEIAKLESFAVNNNESSKFANAGGLKASQFAYLKGVK